MKYKYLLAISSFAFLVGCTSPLSSGSPNQQQEKDNRFEIITTGAFPWLMVDRETGCQYVTNGNDTPYALLYGSDGKPYYPDTTKYE